MRLSLKILLLSALAVSAQITDPLQYMPSPQRMVLADSSSAGAGAFFEQGEFYRKLQASGCVVRPLGGQWFTADSISLMLSPRIGSDQVTQASRGSILLYRSLTPSLKAGAALFALSTGTYLQDEVHPRWETEADLGRVGLLAEYAPGLFGRLVFSAGLQTSGNRNATLNDRRTGPYYEAYGTLEPGEGQWSGYRLFLSEKGALVDRNRSINRQYTLAGLTRFGADDSLSLFANYRSLSNSAFFYARTDRTEKNFAARVSKGMATGFRSAAALSVSQNTVVFPDDPLNNMRNLLVSGRLFSNLEKGPCSLGLSAAYGKNQSEYAFDRSPGNAPDSAGLPAAERQLLDEDAGDAEVRGAFVWRYWKRYAVRFSRLLETRRFDYPVSFAWQGNARISTEAHDLIDDNDTLSVTFPADDTGRLSLSRSSRRLNYLRSERSAANDLSSAYRVALSHRLLRGPWSSQNRVQLGVTEDSLCFPQPGKPPGRFYRRMEFSSGHSLRNIPGLRAADDTMALRGSVAFEENGSLYFNGGRAILINGDILEAGVSAGCQKALLEFLALSFFVNYSESRGTARSAAGTPAETSTLKNLETGLSGVFHPGAWQTFADFRWRRSRFNESMTSNYMYVNLKVNREF